MACMDKRCFYSLFEALAPGLGQNTISPDLMERIIYATAELASKLENNDMVPRSPEWADVVRSAATLAKVNMAHLRVTELHSRSCECKLPDAEWVYTALEYFDGAPRLSTAGLDGLLQALLRYGKLRPKPSPGCIRVMLRALTAPGTVSSLALGVLFRATAWFHEEDLAHTMQQFGVWALVGRIVLENPEKYDLKREYINLGYKLASMPDWEPYIREDISIWLYILMDDMQWDSGTVLKFTSVLQRIWVPH
ncbi:hypothetical protein C8R44DRAFT_813310 [Mycena epipterygia]|nr:hypothetical protein C8R44DRAFT_813310 [Mycena epipterygia]